MNHVPYNIDTINAIICPRLSQEKKNIFILIFDFLRACVTYPIPTLSKFF